MTNPTNTPTPVPDLSPPPPKPGPMSANALKQKTGSKTKSVLGKLWSTGGGGFYGLGYLITFLWYEARLLVGEVAEAEGVVDFVSSQLVERIFRVAIDSFANSIKAFLWPVWLISDYEAWGIGAIVLGALLYKYFLHRRIVGYLGMDPEAEKKAKKAAKKAAAQQAKLEKHKS